MTKEPKETTFTELVQRLTKGQNIREDEAEKQVSQRLFDEAFLIDMCYKLDLKTLTDHIAKYPNGPFEKVMKDAIARIQSEMGESFNPDEQEDKDELNCITCETPLGIPGGMGGTGMCGPCCTGESETLSEFGETW